MKKIIYVLITILVVNSSCSDFLQENNRNGTTHLLYSTPEGYEGLVNACYAFGRTWYGKTEGFSLTELGTDCFTAASGCGYLECAYYADLQGSTAIIEYMWKNLYAALNTCNTALERVDDSGLPDELKRKRAGEVHFLRAFYLWHIVETWGNVCLYTEEINSVVNTAAHTPVDDFYTQIFADLDRAADLLSGTSSKDQGRVTQVVVKAFKARMCLTRGMHAEASRLAKEVIADPSFDIYDSFAETFAIDNSEGTGNKEAIWWVNYCSDKLLNDHFTEGDYYVTLWEGGNHAGIFSAMVYWSYPGMWVSPDVNSPYVQSMPTLSFLNLFDETIDQRYDGTYRTVWIANEDDETSGIFIGDTAVVTVKHAVSDELRASKKYAFLDVNDVYDVNTGLPAGSREYFVSMYKFQDPTRQTGWEIENKRDMFVLRIPEMYLIVAEAEMLQGNTGEAVQYMNVLREKRALPGKEADMRITASDMNIDFILDERAREFAGEHLRWFDLKRTGKLVERVKKYNPDVTRMEEYHTVRPIAQTELDAILNKGEFKQHNGYK